MKKLTALLLAVLLLFCVCGCSNNSGTASGSEKYNLTECVKAGKIPECDIALGTPTANVKAAYNYDENAIGETGFYVISENKSTYFLAGNTSFYFETAKEQNGISSIVFNGTAFGFPMNTYVTMEEVKNAFPTINFTEKNVENKEVYFLPYVIENCKALTYSVDNHRIDFFFEENQLFAVNLVDTANWTLT